MTPLPIVNHRVFTATNKRPTENTDASFSPRRKNCRVMYFGLALLGRVQDFGYQGESQLWVLYFNPAGGVDVRSGSDDQTGRPGIGGGGKEFFFLDISNITLGR